LQGVQFTGFNSMFNTDIAVISISTKINKEPNFNISKVKDRN